MVTPADLDQLKPGGSSAMNVLSMFMQAVYPTLVKSLR
jgi:hypothetical protein